MIDPELRAVLKKTRWNGSVQPNHAGACLTRNDTDVAIPSFNQASRAPSVWANDHIGKLGEITATANAAGVLRVASVGHGMLLGEFVHITMEDPDNEANGYYEIVAVPDVDHFDITQTWVATDTGHWDERYGVPVTGLSEVEVAYRYNAGAAPAVNLRPYYSLEDLDLFVQDEDTKACAGVNRIFKIDLSALVEAHGSIDIIYIVGEGKSANLDYDIFVMPVTKQP